jgi:uncharacterized protein YndB with AHSA1/START domain
MPLIDVTADGSDLVLTWSLTASADHVWELLTKPGLISTWLGDVVDGEIAAESTFTIDHGEGTLCRSLVLECMAPQFLRYTWDFPDEPATELEWKLDRATHSSNTTLTLTHSLPGELIDSYRGGWPVHLTYLEAASLGEPLPSAMFWNLHATMSRLTDA